jgi:hypothetical protein
VRVRARARARVRVGLGVRVGAGIRGYVELAVWAREELESAAVRIFLLAEGS